MTKKLDIIETYFPDVVFERHWGCVEATLPNVYVSHHDAAADESSACANRSRACLAEHGQRNRASFTLEPLKATGWTKEACAADIFNQIRHGGDNVYRHALNPDSDVIPVEGIRYFPVFNDDRFHQHGDPSFIDLAPISYADGSEAPMGLPDAVLVDAFGDDALGIPMEPLSRMLGDVLGEELSGGKIVITMEVGGPVSDPFSLMEAMLSSDDDLSPHDMLFTMMGPALLADMIVHDQGPSIPINYPPEGAILFDVTYGDMHSHYIDSPTLTAKLEI